VKASLGSKFEVGDEKTWWSFSSTTSSINVLQNEMFLGKSGERTIFNIDATCVFDISKYSAIPSESELLLPPNSELQVKGCLDTGHGLTMVHLQQLAYHPLLSAIVLSSGPSPVDQEEAKQKEKQHAAEEEAKQKEKQRAAEEEARRKAAQDKQRAVEQELARVQLQQREVEVKRMKAIEANQRTTDLWVAAQNDRTEEALSAYVSCLSPDYEAIISYKKEGQAVVNKYSKSQIPGVYRNAWKTAGRTVYNRVIRNITERDCEFTYSVAYPGYKVNCEAQMVFASPGTVSRGLYRVI
jgi:hypothetical protein